MELRKMIIALIEASSLKEGRPCRLRCKDVFSGNECKGWEGQILEIWNKRPEQSEDIKKFAIILFFLIHTSAYERWEETFDYACIDCRLHLAAQTLKIAEEKFLPNEKGIIEALILISDIVHHMTLIENSMVANDPVSMKYHCKCVVEIKSLVIKALKSIKSKYQWLMLISEELLKNYESSLILDKTLLEITNLFYLINTNREEFKNIYNTNRSQYYDVVKQSEKGGFIEAATEIRAHLSFLDFNNNLEDVSFLNMNHIEGKLSFGFFKEIRDIKAELIKNSLPRSSSELINYLQEKIEETKLENFPVPILAVSSDSAPDILESAIGALHFENILLFFDDIKVYKLSKQENSENELLFELTPKIIHYALGVGCLDLEFKISEINISTFQVLKNIGTPHSPEYLIKWESKEDLTEKNVDCIWSRLHEFAHDLINAYCNTFDQILQENIKEDNPLKTNISNAEWIDPTQSWFTSFLIHEVIDDKGKLLDYDDLKNHWQWPGLIMYQRADRATIDDWMKINPEYASLSNLAFIRGHRGDLYILSENHSIIYCPDDPKFITAQYVVTSKWMFLIKTLVMYCIVASDVVLNDLKSLIETSNKALKGDLSKSKLKELEDQIHNKKIELHNYNLLALKAINHIASAGVSQYADHGLLLRKAFDEISLPKLSDFLLLKLDTLKNQEEEINTIVERILHIRETKSQERLELLVASISILQILPTVDAIYQIFFVGTLPNIEYFIVLFISITIIVGCLIFFIKLKK
ncbi:MAG: hypothetical protein ACFFAS_18635 [Promethearchaeota archaeon]